MKELTEMRIRQDNPHFGPVLRVVEEGPYESEDFDFTFLKVVGAEGSKCPQRGSLDARASYLWSPSKNDWVLGAN